MACTITGIILDVFEQPAVGVNVYVCKSIRSETIIEQYQRLAATSDEDGEVTFDVPEDSSTWISGNFYIGSTDCNVSGGVQFVIPDEATITFEELGTAVSTPNTNATQTALDAEEAARIAADLTKQPIATGTPNGTKFLRDDNSWQTAGGGGTWGGITGTLSAQTDLQAALDPKATFASPALTGTPTAPTAAAATNTTQLATTAFVRTEVANLVASAPGALDTLDELAAALGDDANFAATVTSALAAKANLVSPSFTTPVLGAASATSLTATGAIQTNVNLISGDGIGDGNIYVRGSLDGGSYKIRLLASEGVFLASNRSIQFTNAVDIFGTSDTRISRNAAGIVQIGTTSANALGSILSGRVVVAKTGNYPIVAASDNSKFFINAGAVGEVDFTLPSAVAGLTFSFYVQAAQILKIIAGASTTIRVAGLVTAAAGNIQNATVGGCVTLVAISATEWAAESSVGTWT